jgi:hypothetical protein
VESATPMRCSNERRKLITLLGGLAAAPSQANFPFKRRPNMSWSSMFFVPRVTDIPAQETNPPAVLCWRRVMNTTFHPYRLPVWSGFKRYFFEWRQRALIRRELRMLSDCQWEDIIPSTPAHDGAGRA